MNKFKQWAKDNKDLLIIGGCFAGATAITVALVLVARGEDSGPFSFAVSDEDNIFKDHQFLGVASVGAARDIWVHPIGQAAVQTNLMAPLNTDVDINDLDAVEAAMVAEEIAETN